jgi:RNA polymerase sigma-70 factor, ECF subfamily
MPDFASDSAETQDLLTLACAGDRSAFDRLFALHRPYLRRVIELRFDRRLQARVDPSDVVQETQLEAYRRLPDYFERRPMTFRLWLRKTAQERLLMLRRFHLGSARRDVGREVLWPEGSSLQLARELVASSPTPSQEIDGRERARHVQEAVAQLPRVDREILVLRNLEGLSNAEVAELMQVDPATASRVYGRALLRLRAFLVSHNLEASEP